MNTFTEQPVSDEVWEELESIASEALEGELVDPEDCLTLAFTRADAHALAEFLAFIAVTYNHLPMIAEQIILTIGDWDREDSGSGE